MRPRTAYPLPPLRDELPPFPAAPPLARGLADLAGWWLDVHCPCKGGMYLLPLRLLAAQHGWNRPLSDVLRRLRCKGCGQPPSSVELIEDAAGGASGRGGSPQRRRLRLI